MDGAVQEQGSHDQLMALGAGGHYARLVQSQNVYPGS